VYSSRKVDYNSGTNRHKLNNKRSNFTDAGRRGCEYTLGWTFADTFSQKEFIDKQI